MKSATLPQEFSFVFFLHFLKQNKTKTRIKSTVAAVSLCSLNPIVSSFCARMNMGLQLTLGKNKLHPLQLLVLIVFSPTFHGERESSQLVPVSSSLQEWKGAHGEGSSFQFLEKIKLQSLVERHQVSMVCDSPERHVVLEDSRDSC